MERLIGKQKNFFGRAKEKKKFNNHLVTMVQKKVEKKIEKKSKEMLKSAKEGESISSFLDYGCNPNYSDTVSKYLCFCECIFGIYSGKITRTN